MSSEFFFKTFVTPLLAAIVTGSIFCVTHLLHLYTSTRVFILFSASFCVLFLSTGIATSVTMHILSCLFLIQYLAYFP
jgi:hypothetical protein